MLSHDVEEQCRLMKKKTVVRIYHVPEKVSSLFDVLFLSFSVQCTFWASLQNLLLRPLSHVLEMWKRLLRTRPRVI